MTTPEITVHGFVPYDRSGRVRWLLEELGLAYKSRWVDFRAGENRSPDFLAMSPAGKVPVVEVGDVTLFESGAALLYLAERFGGEDLAPPSEPARRAAFLSWFQLASATLDPICFEFVRPDLEEAEVEPRRARAGKEAARILPGVERALAGQHFLVRDHFSIADLQLGCALVYARAGGALEEHPGLVEYLDRLMARPAASRSQAFKAS